jgi:sugar phosphate isomerase/epimerase
LNSCGSSATAAPARKSFIGLQTYSLGGELTADVPAGLKRVYDAGYTDLELAGYRDGMQGEYTMAEYKKMADDAGLKISGAHVGPSSRNYTKEGMAEMSEFWKKAVADHVILGVTTIVQPSMPTVTSEFGFSLRV